LLLGKKNHTLFGNSNNKSSFYSTNKVTTARGGKEGKDVKALEEKVEKLERMVENKRKKKKRHALDVKGDSESK